MKKHLSILCLSIIFIFQACESNIANESKNERNYPRIIDSLHLEQWYDSTKWYLYTYYCMDTPSVSMGNGNAKNIVDKPYSSLELVFDSVTIKNDSFSLYFSFYNEMDHKLINYFNYEEWTGAINGLMFSRKNADTTLCFVRSNSSMPLEWISFPRSSIDTTSFRRVRTLQPEVLQFISKNKDSLNYWFYNQASKRGLLK